MAFDPARPMTLAAQADAQLLLAVQTPGAEAAARAALAELYRRHGGAVYRFAWLVCGSEALAADVLQDTFVALLDGAGRFDPARGSCAAWLCGVARHLAYRRFDRRTVPLDDDAGDRHASVDAPGALAPPPEDALAHAQALQTLHAAIRQLPSHYREVLVLIELQELSYADVAMALGIELGTVRSRLSRARARLLELMQPLAAIGTGDS